MSYDMIDLLKIAVDKNASDLHVSVGTSPSVRVNGDLALLDEFAELRPEDTEHIVRSVLTDAQLRRLEDVGEIDFSFGAPGVGRFRVNVFRQRGTYALVARTIPSTVKPFDQLGLPSKVLEHFCSRSRGLVLVTGPTGGGKSTTLASMIDYINQTRACHIVTLEDPIEYLHRHAKSVTNQREIGSDTHSFTSGLRACLREDPDVILVGDMPDLETVAAVIRAAETGHLVFASLHTSDCTQTIHHIIDSFPLHQQQQARMQLSLVLEGVISQQLVPTKDRLSQAVAVEVMVMNSAIRNLISEGKTHQILSIIQTGGKYGMQTMDASLRDLILRDLISVEDALLRSSNPEELKRSIRIT